MEENLFKAKKKKRNRKKKKQKKNIGKQVPRGYIRCDYCPLTAFTLKNCHIRRSKINGCGRTDGWSGVRTYGPLSVKEKKRRIMWKKKERKKIWW